MESKETQTIETYTYVDGQIFSVSRVCGSTSETWTKSTSNPDKWVYRRVSPYEYEIKSLDYPPPPGPSIEVPFQVTKKVETQTYAEPD